MISYFEQERKQDFQLSRWLVFSKEKTMISKRAFKAKFEQLPQSRKEVVFETYERSTLGVVLGTVTTCLVVLSSKFYFWKNRLRRRNPRRNVMGTTDRRGCLIPKHLEILKFGCWNRLSKLCNEIAGRTVTDPWWKFGSLNFATTCRTDHLRHDGPSQVAQSQSGSDFFIRFKGRYWLFLP